MILQKNASLQSLNTFRVAAQTRYYAHIDTVQALRALLLRKEVQHLPQLILGSGSNLLFVNDFPGIVIQMATGQIATIREDKAHVWIRAGAGVNWHQLVLHCLANNYAGLENLSLIPGTVGAAPIQNIGAYGVELCDLFDSLEAMEKSSGTIHTFDRTACAFGYRDSIFKNSLKDQYIILNVTLKLPKQPNFQTTYGAIQRTLQAMKVQNISIQAISDAVIHIRQSKLPDPAILGNAGSFFKNPILPASHFEKLKSSYPQMPSYEQPVHRVKIPAAWLIDHCGWKGYRRGDVGVHKTQPLVLVNYGHATGQEIYQLAQDIQQSIKVKFGIALIPEVNIIT